MKNSLFTNNLDSGISIYTDGSCIGNPGPGGYAAIFIKDNEIVKTITGATKYTTNNRMEMMAILVAIEYLNANQINTKVRLFSDSNLLVSTINKNWKKKANTDLWEKIDNELITLNIDFTWVKAHADNKWNNYCDKLAFHEAKHIK